MYNDFIESVFVPLHKKPQRIKKYCRAAKKIAKRLLRDSKFDEQLMSPFINCKQTLQKQIQDRSTHNQESSNNNQESSGYESNNNQESSGYESINNSL
jgi:protease II